MSEPLTALQEYIWDLLPHKKHTLGKEVVYDMVAAAVQEWPDDEYVASKSGDTGELKASLSLQKSVKRHMQVLYGDSQFGTFWVLAMQLLLPLVIDLMLRWWRRRERNRKMLRYWRRKWTNG